VLVVAELLTAFEYGCPANKKGEPKRYLQDKDLILAVAERCQDKFPEKLNYLTNEDREMLSEKYGEDISSCMIHPCGSGASIGKFWWFEMDYSFFEDQTIEEPFGGDASG